MAEIKYQYAYDESGSLINVNDLSKEVSKQHHYKCISCGSELLPRAIGSKYRKPHFYHRNIVNCNSETYLHKLAKRLIKSHFEKADHFIISHLATLECSETGCSIRNYACKQENQLISYDLKKYYDICEEEKEIDGFVADLLLSDSRNPEKQNILIEICVSHACEEDKRNSGLKIIELKITKEQDIEDFINKTEVECYCSNLECINFKKYIKKRLDAPVPRYIINDTGNGEGFFVKVGCTKSGVKVRRNSEWELNVIPLNKEYAYSDRPELIPLYWLYKHCNYRNCFVCKYYNQTISENVPSCKYNAKHGKDRYPNMEEANICRIFSPKIRTKDLEDFIIGNIIVTETKPRPEYKVIVAGSSYVCDNEQRFEQICLRYLSKKLETHEVIIISGTAFDIENMTKQFCDKYKIQMEPHKALWGKYEQRAAYISNEEMIKEADALIVFLFKNSRCIGHLIDLARKKGIRIAEPTI